MKIMQNQVIFIAAISLFILLIYKLSPILTPFLLGGLLAYLVDPLVKRLEKKHFPHLVSVILIFLFLFTCIILFFALLYPLIYKQVELIVNLLPEFMQWIQTTGMPWVLQFVNVDAIKPSLPATVSTTLSKSGWVLSTFISSSKAFIDIIISIVLTPIVTFYLLRDWDQVLKGTKSLLPKKSAPTILAWAKKCDEVLGAFIRGQLLVMLCLCLIYSLGLTIIGLQFGLVIGIIGGVLSIAPFVGSIFILIAGLIGMAMQYGTLSAIISVLIVFAIAQFAETYILTPYFVGERIGLHPVAVIFSVMAGGVLFGFFGILLALPVSAMLMATFRFFRQHPPVAAAKA